MQESYRQSLLEIYPELAEHALVNFNAADVMVFLGRKLTGNFQGETITDTEKRPQGVRMKHRMKKNSLKKEFFTEEYYSCFDFEYRMLQMIFWCRHFPWTKILFVHDAF